MSVKKLQHPTVKDMIDALSTYPSDMMFSVCDTDTNWQIHTFTMRSDVDGVIIEAEYTDMDNIWPSEKGTT